MGNNGLQPIVSVIFIRSKFIIYFQEPTLSTFEDCPYLKNKKMRQEYMLAFGLTSKEFSKLLSKGWRRFGIYFFKPNCEYCFQCVPIRINAINFTPSKSQRRILNKNKNTKVVFNKLNYKKEMLNIYKEHSFDRFRQITDTENFKNTFFVNAVPACQSEYYINNKLVATGFIDISSNALSSVYFVYKTKYNNLSLGIFGILKEIEYAKSLNLKYYYLGYYIKDNHSMSYKNKFNPHDFFDWKKQKWYNPNDKKNN